MKFSILTLTACLLIVACAGTTEAKQETTPERSTELPAPPPAQREAAAAGERVQPEIRYYEVADT